MATKRRFEALRRLILRGLLPGQKTINQLCKDAGINWRTVDNHLIHLIGKGYVRPVFQSKYVKIYELTEAGRQAAGKEVAP